MKKQELEDLSGTVSVVWATPQIDELLTYMARVSNPANQNNPNIKGLLHHMMEEGHVSPFDMCNVTFEINTTRDVGRQLLRHWSLKVQEFSQRYQSVDKLGDFVLREFREQDTKNRQASVEVADDDPRAVEWLERQKRLFTLIQADYDWMLSVGGAKEQARVVLPEGCTRTRMYFNGTLRSWIHYIGERKKGSTQKEHQKIARAVLELLRTAAPVTMEAFFPTESVKETIQIPLDGFKQVLKDSLAYMKLEVDERSTVYVLHNVGGQGVLESLALGAGGNAVYTDMQEAFEHQRIKDFAAIYLITPLDRSEFDNLQGLLNTRSNCGKSTVVYVVAGDGW